MQCVGKNILFCKVVGLLSYLNLLFTFWPGTHWVNEELGRHRGREGNKECVLCGNECEGVSHVLWECSAYYSSSRDDFLLKLQEKLAMGSNTLMH